MLAKLYETVCENARPKIKKYSAILGEASDIGAFPCGDRILISVCVPRTLGVTGVIMRMDRDGEAGCEYELSFAETSLDIDLYRIELDTDIMTGGSGDGLFYYDFVFCFGGGKRILYTDSLNNVDFELSETDGTRFRLTVYDKNYKTPEWFGGGVIYQIFTDRFFKGEGYASLRDDAELNTDWDNGIPQFGESSGDAVSNNVFFGGNLWGVCEKLPYLRSLGVTIIYLCPIFKAYSNHKYDTGDYLTIDPMFGGDEAFKKLLHDADEQGIKIILDGVFNHTGVDSIYFNKFGTYDSIGAYQSQESEYYRWYNFKQWRESYEAWWGIEILPRLDHSFEPCRKFFTDTDGVAAKYIKMGVAGWRLDVADELSNAFLDELRETVKKVSCGEAVIIGEVWENAADKISYGERRRYLRGKQLDSVMNYPLRSAVIDYVRMGDASILADTLTELWSSYPRMSCDTLMNIVGTHDTERILTVLGGTESFGKTNKELSVMKMSSDQYLSAKKLLKLVSTIQYTVFGVPSLYYGDEVGAEGYHDPFCRRPFPWNNADTELTDHYRRLGKIRSEHKAYDRGDYKLLKSERGLIAFMRISLDGNDKVLTLANVGDVAEELSFVFDDTDCTEYIDLLTGEVFTSTSMIEPDRAIILYSKYSEDKNMCGTVEISDDNAVIDPMWEGEVI